MDTLYIVHTYKVVILIITNQKDFDKILNIAITKCIGDISNKILECVQDHIWQDMYAYAYFPNAAYNNGTGKPTFEFREAFRFEGIKKSINEISNKLFYDWSTMSKPSQSNPYLHGNFNKGIDRRSILADLLNVNGIDGENDWGGKDRNAFWDNALKDINTKFDGWAREAYNKYLK